MLMPYDMFQDSGSVIFHLFTDTQNLYAMKHWFDRNSYLEATVNVINIEDHHKLSMNAGSLERQQLPTTPFSRFRLLPFRSPLLRESLLLSFPLATKMFQFARIKVRLS